MPVYEADPGHLREAVESVRAQVYPEWELIVVDDGSSRADTRGAVERLSSGDSRITVRVLEENQGIAAATNHGLELCRGALVAFLDQDDLLSPDALLRFGQRFAESEFDVAYSDQDKITAGGATADPFFKPDWSPVYALGAMYVGHLLVARRELVSEVGGLDSEFDVIQDYELLLRLSERAERIDHIPETLYHWRAIPGSFALGTSEKEDVSELQVKAVKAHLERRGIEAVPIPNPEIPHRLALRPAAPATQPLVSVIVPARAGSGPGLAALRERTSYPSLEEIVVDAGEGFRPAELANRGARDATGEFLVFLDERAEPTEPDWVEQLLTYALMPGVGAVGPVLTHPDGRVDAAGAALGLHDPAAPVMRGFPGDADGYYGSLSCAREVSAIGMECMLVGRTAFDRAGGFEEAFSRQFQDLDLCLRLRKLGLSIVCAPSPRTIAHATEAQGRADFDVLDRALFVDRAYETLEQGDPFYSRRFFPEAADYRVSPFSGDPQALAMREAVG